MVPAEVKYMSKRIRVFGRIVLTGCCCCVVCLKIQHFQAVLYNGLWSHVFPCVCPPRIRNGGSQTHTVGESTARANESFQTSELALWISRVFSMVLLEIRPWTVTEKNHFPRESVITWEDFGLTFRNQGFCFIAGIFFSCPGADNFKRSRCWGMRPYLVWQVSDIFLWCEVYVFINQETGTETGEVWRLFERIC